MLTEYGQSVHGIQCHVAKKEDRQRLFATTVERYGGLDILVSNAAVNPAMGSIIDVSEEIWTKIFEINVTASFMLLKEATPLLQKRGGGSIIFISSIAGCNASPVDHNFHVDFINSIVFTFGIYIVYSYSEHIALVRQHCSDCAKQPVLNWHRKIFV